MACLQNTRKFLKEREQTMKYKPITQICGKEVTSGKSTNPSLAAAIQHLQMDHVCIHVNQLGGTMGLAELVFPFTIG